MLDFVLFFKVFPLFDNDLIFKEKETSISYLKIRKTEREREEVFLIQLFVICYSYHQTNK